MESAMWNEITGAQLGLLFAVQRAWVREMVAIHSRWKTGRIVKRFLNMTGEQQALQSVFVCGHCGKSVSVAAPGARQRSHCPHCLWSLHVARSAGQVGTPCRGQMEPVGVLTQAGGEWSLVHHCRRCNTTQMHCIAVDDNAAALLTIAARRASAAVSVAEPAAGPAAGEGVSWGDKSEAIPFRHSFRVFSCRRPCWVRLFSRSSRRIGRA
jgi:hypothetical protein